MPLRNNILNVSRRKVGGIWFVKLGRINLSFSVSRPKSTCEVQTMRCITVRAAELNAHGATMEVNYDA